MWLIVRLLVARMLGMAPRAMLTLILLLAPYAALSAGFNQGDLLVTDNGGSRVLRVNVTNGAVSLFSPPSGGTNLLSFPAGIAIAADGTVYVASNGSNKVIQIDPLTGVQTLLPFGVGQRPWGLDMDTAGDLFILTQTAGEVWKITRPAGPSGFSSKVVTDSLLAEAWGLAAQADGTLRIGGDISGLLAVDPSLVTPTVSIVEPPEEVVMKVVGVSRLESTTQFGPGSGATDCSGRLAGVWYHWPPSWQRAAANGLNGVGPFHCVEA